MKRTLPLLITALSGFILIVAFFIPSVQFLGETAAIWFDILASIAFILGGGNLLKQHLQKVSDRREGWGYSAIILVSFLAAMFFGLTKWGSFPLGMTEYLGESFAPFSIDQLPVYSVPGTLATRADGEPLPASVRRQISQVNEQLQFRGWMNNSQLEDLFKYQDDLKWRATVESLHEASQPPEALKLQLSHHADQGVLSFRGMMTTEQEAALRELLKNATGSEQAVDTLAAESRRENTIQLPLVPTGFAIPQSEQDHVKLDGNRLSVVGPVSPGLRSAIATDWAHLERVRSLSAADRQQLQQAIEAAGEKLSEAQLQAFQKYLDTLDTSADILLLTLNSAGVAPSGEKNYRQLYEEFLQGKQPLERTIPPTVSDIALNPEQWTVLQSYATNGKMTGEELKAQLAAAGGLNDKMRRKIDDYEASLPTRAAVERVLCLSLLAEGPLSTAQKELLVHRAREEQQWRQSIGRLTIKAHQTKYPWSGDYTQDGTPFWWLYEYVFQPLLTTTFAVLAFYVASAAFRAFRAKNLEATLLLGTAFLILLRPTILGAWFSAIMPPYLSMDNMTSFIMGTMNTAGNRAIMIGIALGIASTSLKVLLGIDRSYLGSSDD